MRLSILYADPVRPQQMQAIAARFPQCTWMAARDSAVPSEQKAQADVLVGWLQPPWTNLLTKVQWIQILSTGVPPEVERWCRDRGVKLTRTVGVYANSMAEHTLMLMLALARRLDASLQHQRNREWAWPCFPPPADLAGTTLGIVGAGAIGQAVARLARGFGMRVIGCRRTAQSTPGFDHMFSLDQLAEMAAQSDWLVIAVPAVAQTTGLVRRDVIMAMPTGGRVINIARGAVLDETALIEALESGHLAGAALDVCQQEPLPTDHPLWSAPNLIITPHTGGSAMMAAGGYLDYFARNLHRYLAGEMLQGLVE